MKSYAAIVKRWDGEVKRLTAMVAKQVVDLEVLSETTRQLESSQALLEASQVTVLTRDAQRLAAEATVERTDADIGTADARVPVAIAEERRLAALVDYLTITAPYDGVVLARNVNLGDFVLPASGDPSQGAFSLGVSPNQATPLYVLNRIDPVLFVIGVPEADAAYVAAGSSGPRAGTGAGEPRVPGAGDADLLGAQPHQPHAHGPGRAAQPKGEVPPRHVRLRVGAHRAAQRTGVAGVGGHPDRQPDLLLPGAGR